MALSLFGLDLQLCTAESACMWEKMWGKHVEPLQTRMVLDILAETVRFELTEGSPLRQFSRLLV